MLLPPAANVNVNNPVDEFCTHFEAANLIPFTSCTAGIVTAPFVGAIPLTVFTTLLPTVSTVLFRINVCMLSKAVLSKGSGDDNKIYPAKLDGDSIVNVPPLLITTLSGYACSIPVLTVS
jgi:hypothetical protein